MKRIDFFKQLFLSSSLFLIPKPSTTRPKIKFIPIKLSTPYVAGYQYYDGPAMEKRLNVEELLVLKREPDNNFDRSAIELFCRGSKLGYLPKAENKVIARMMDQGVIVKARIAQLDLQADPYRRIKIELYYEEKTIIG